MVRNGVGAEHSQQHVCTETNVPPLVFCLHVRNLPNVPPAYSSRSPKPYDASQRRLVADLAYRVITEQQRLFVMTVPSILSALLMVYAERRCGAPWIHTRQLIGDAEVITSGIQHRGFQLDLALRNPPDPAPTVCTHTRMGTHAHAETRTHAETRVHAPTRAYTLSCARTFTYVQTPIPYIYIGQLCSAITPTFSIF